MGGIRYNTEDESAILVTVAEELRIVVSSSPTEPAKYIDLPLECIQQVTLQSQLNTQSQTSSYAVIIHLAAATEHTYYLNAVGHNDDAILLAFMSEIHATTIKNIVLPNRRHPAEIRMSQQPIDCSRPVSNGESAGPDLASTSDQDLRETSSQAASSRARHPPSTTVPPAANKLTSASRVKTTQLNVSETGLRPEDDENMEWAAVAISNAMEDIPVGLHLNAGNAQVGTGVQQPAISPADIASMRPTTQLSVLDDREQIQQDEDQGFDSSYDVSPRVSKVAPNESKSKMPPAPMSIQTSELHNEAGDDITNNAPPSKLSRSVRNGDRKLEIGIEPPSSSDPETKAGRDAKASTNSIEPKSGKAKAPAKGKGRIQIKQPPKKAIASKVKAKALADKREENDEFDLPESPERPKAKSMASGVPHEIAQAPGEAMGKTRTTNVSHKESLNAPSLASRTVSSVKRQATSKPPVRPAKPSKADEIEDESIWNFGPDASDEDHDIDPKQGTKTKAKAKAKIIKKQPPNASKVEKREKPQSKAKKSGTRESAKLPPATLNEPRSRRAAAEKANEKILRIEEFDEIVDDGEEGPVAKPQKKSAAAAITQPARATQAQKSKTYINDRAPSIATESEVEKTAATKFMAPVENAKATSQVESGSEIEDTEEVDLVADITRQVTEKTGITPMPPSTAIGADSLLGSEVTSPEQGGTGTNEAMFPTGDKDTHEKSAQDPKRPFVPDSVPKMPDRIQDTKQAFSEPLMEGDDTLEPVQMVGGADDSHFQEALPDREPRDQEETEISPNEPQPTLKPDKPKEMPSSKGKVNGKAVAKIDHADDRQSVKSIQPILEPRQLKIKAYSSKLQDPFCAKLNFLAQETEQINSEVQKPAGFQVADISKTTKQFKATAPQAIQVEAAKNTEYTGKIRQPVQAKVEDKAKNVKAPRKINDQAVAEKVVNREAQTLQETHRVRNHGKPNRKTENGNLGPHQEISKEDTTVLPGPAIGNKRKIGQDGPAEQKKPKLTPVKKDIKRVENKDNKVQKIKRDLKAKYEEVEPEMDEDQGTPIPEFSRKPEIISFSASGPRNQGIASKKKPKCSKHSKMADRFSQELRRTLERETAPYVDDPAPWEHEQHAKSHKRDVTPPAAHKHVPQMIPEPEPMAIQDRPHRLSSQSTRVNENGSPVPIAHPRNESSTAQERYLEDDNVRDAFQNAQLDDDDQSIIQGDGYNRDEVALPPVRKNPILRRDNMGFVGLPNNSKQVPSSPHAPSAFASMPAHHVYQDGKIVNPETTKKIIPTELHDPFVGDRRVQTSSFIETLRNLSDREVQGLRNGPKEQKPAAKVTRHSLLFNDDPDKTLVEPEPVRKKRKYETISTSSSSSESVTSEDTSPSQAVTPYQSDAETLAQWRKAYEPHQGNMLDVLSNITHVSHWHSLETKRNRTD